MFCNPLISKPEKKQGKNAIKAGFDGGHCLALFRAQPLALRTAVHVLLASSSFALKNFLEDNTSTADQPLEPQKHVDQKTKLTDVIHLEHF